MRLALLLPACVVALLGLPISVTPAVADVPTFTLTLKDHKFDQTVLEVPAGQKIKLIVRNQDTMPEEFESTSLKREKLIPSGGQVTVFVGPLKPGDYDFFGEFHMDTAKGVIRAKAE